MNETDKLIEEQVKTLPPNLKRAIDDVPWKALAQEIGKANALDAEQITSLEQEVMFIIYAFEPPTEFIANIMHEVGISEDVASVIAESVANKIFDPILQKNEELEKTAQTKTEPVAPTSVPPASAPNSAKDMPDKQGSAMTMEIPPNNLPMVEPGETAHEVPHVEQPKAQSVQPVGQDLVDSKESVETSEPKPSVSTPDYRYPDGKDPYREPLG